MSEVVIRLKLESEGGSGTDSAIKKGTGDVSSTTKTASGKEEGNDNSVAGAAAAFAAIQLVSIAARDVVTWTNYEWDKALQLNDDYIGQRNKAILNTAISKTTSAIGSIAASTAAGASVGGVWGAAIGFAIGTVSAVGNIHLANYQAMDQQNIQIRQMEAQLGFTRSRQGWSTEAGSIGEDL